jgi:cysteine-rich repeat protein
MRRHALAVVAMLAGTAAGCLQFGDVVCASGRVCAPGTMCVGDDLCATPEQLAACAGIADGDTCSIFGIVGSCYQGVCTPSGCGNGVLDPGEACDDGNATSGDGCRADCRKLEVCGDGILDEGEGCDDGNDNPADGCDACTPTTWRPVARIGGTTAATTIGLAAPYDVAVDPAGNVYVVESESALVRRIDANGIVTTIAGSTSGFSGDHGPATSARLGNPEGIAVDGLGHVYIADTKNHRVRRVDAFGIITSLAGTGTPAYGGDQGLATNATLNAPSALAIDGLGNLFIADRKNHRIRRIDATTGVITTVAGTGTAGFSGDGGAATSAQLAEPQGVAVDALGTIYIADTNNHRLRVVAANGVITTLAGTGVAGTGGDGEQAFYAQLSSPGGVTVDGFGNVFVAVYVINPITAAIHSRIRKIDTNGVITTFAGGGTSITDGVPATHAALHSVQGVAVGAMGDIYMSDIGYGRVRRVDASGTIMTVAGDGSFGLSGDGGAATSTPFLHPWGTTVDPLGNVLIAEHTRVRRIDGAGEITTVVGNGSFGFSGDGGPATSAELFYASDVAVDGLGNMYVADEGNQRIRRIDANGVIATIAGSGGRGYNGDGQPAVDARLSNPSGVAADGLGNVYIADTYNHRVRRVDANGMITTIAGTGTSGFGGDQGPATSAQLARPWDLMLDAAGNVYVCDLDNHRIRKIDTLGIITTVAGTGTRGFAGDGGSATAAQLDAPSGIAVDAIGNLYIADRGNLRIRRVDPAGVITTFAGNGGLHFSGDGASATAARLGSPLGVAVDAADNVYATVSTTSQQGFVRRIASDGTITSIAGPAAPEGMGPLARARFADPRAIASAGVRSFVAGGSTGTVQSARTDVDWLEVVAGRYPQTTSTGGLARYRDQSFGSVSGVAVDVTSGLIFLSESTANRLHVVTIVDPADASTWTIAPLANAAGTAGFGDGAAQTASFRAPTGLFYDESAAQLYVADAGNHVVRRIDLAGGVAGATVHTVAGTPGHRGHFGDGGAAQSALLFAPQAITRCSNGDLFVADTGNHRVRRVDAQTGTISTVLGDGVAASSGDGRPASTFPVNTPLGLACDTRGNLFVTSTTTVRLLAADASGVIDGNGLVQSIYGAPPRDTFPASVTRCLTGLVVLGDATLQVVDSCTGLLVELHREPL